MDQGPIEPPPASRWSMSDTRDLVVAAVSMQVVAGVVAAGIAGAWTLASGSRFLDVILPSTLIVACLLPMSSYTSRYVDASTKGWTDSATIGRVGAFFGDRNTQRLEPTGVVLFVSLPLIGLGMLLGVL